MRDEIKALLETGLVRHTQSPFASPCMLINKPDGGHRLLINYAKSNAQCYCQACPIHRIDDLIDRVGQAKFLTKLNIIKHIGMSNWMKTILDIPPLLQGTTFIIFNVAFRFIWSLFYLFKPCL